MKKKILYVITKSNMGGAQRYVCELATGLPKGEYDVAVAFGGNGELKTVLESAGIKTFPIRNFERDINMIKEIRALFELRDIIREFCPDIVHLNSSKAGGTGALIARLMGVRHIIFTAHGWAFNEPRGVMWQSIVWFLSWVTALLCHTIILVSQYDLKRTRMPFVQNKCTVVPTAIPPFRLHSQNDARSALFTQTERELHAKDFWLVTVAELTHNKNVLTGVKAVAEYNRTHDRHIYYTIIGDGELRSDIEAYIKTEQLSDSVKLAGYVQNAREYLRAFDAFMLPSHKEGMPYAILEAGHAGLPVIASNVGGIPEVVTHGVTGLLTEPASVTSFVRVLEILTDEPGRAQTFAAELSAHVQVNHDLATMRTRTEALYRSR